MSDIASTSPHTNEAYHRLLLCSHVYQLSNIVCFVRITHGRISLKSSIALGHGRQNVVGSSLYPTAYTD